MLQWEKFEILVNMDLVNLVKILVNLVDMDAHDFYKWTKKDEANSTIKVLFLSLDEYK